MESSPVLSDVLRHAFRIASIVGGLWVGAARSPVTPGDDEPAGVTRVISASEPAGRVLEDAALRTAPAMGETGHATLEEVVRCLTWSAALNRCNRVRTTLDRRAGGE